MKDSAPEKFDCFKALDEWPSVQPDAEDSPLKVVEVKSVEGLLATQVDGTLDRLASSVGGASQSDMVPSPKSKPKPKAKTKKKKSGIIGLFEDDKF
jgi:hypothetical protein